MMSRLLPVCSALVLLATLAAPPAAGHGPFTVKGTAQSDDAIFTATVQRSLQQNFRVTIVEPVSGAVVVDASFPGSDNYEAPGATVRTYHAESTDPSVHFHLDGVLVGEFVFTTGHYEGYDLVLRHSVLNV